MGSLRPIAIRFAVMRASLVLSDKPVLGELEDNLESLSRLPKKISRLTRVLESGDFSSEIRVKDLSLFTQAMRRAANRMAEAVVVASLILGSALIYSSDLGPHWSDMPLFGAIGFVLSGVLGLILLWQITFGKDR
jgi:ubiquinone biosynthesis protein